jgi:hypothetical protein
MGNDGVRWDDSPFTGDSVLRPGMSVKAITAIKGPTKLQFQGERVAGYQELVWDDPEWGSGDGFVLYYQPLGDKWCEEGTYPANVHSTWTFHLDQDIGVYDIRAYKNDNDKHYDSGDSPAEYVGTP